MREILLTSSVLILALLLLRRLFRNTVSRRVQYALWALVLVRLLVPVSLPAMDFSVLRVSEPVQEQLEERWERRTAPLPSGMEGLERPVGAAASAGSAAASAKSGAPEPRRTFDAAKTAALVWKLGAAAMACWVAVSNLRFWRRLRRARVPFAAPQCRYPVYLVEEGLRSPCLFGFLRPAVYLTPAAAAQPSLGHVLAHEETHARHLDPLWSLLRSVCLAVYWFDPLVWWAAAASREDCELACDEGALARLGEAERIPYGRTLLALVPVRRGAGNPVLAATTMTAGKKRLKERITRIAENRRCGVLASCVLLALVTAACAATFSGGGTSPAPAASAPETGPIAAPAVIDREPVLSIPLTGLEPYVVEDDRITAEDFRPGTLEPDTVSVDTMGEVLVDKTLSDGTRIVCYWDPAPENEYTKYWAIRDGDTLLRFYREESGYNRDYDVEEYTGLFDHDGFVLYAPRGAAYFAIDYWYLDENGTPQMLVDCSNEVIRADWNGDGEDDLMWFYHTGPYLYFRRDGVLYLASVLGMVEEAWPEAQFLGYDMPEDDSGSCIEIYGFLDAPSEVTSDGFAPLFAPREVYFQGDYMNLYKPLEPAVTLGVYDSIDAPEEVLEAAKQTASEELRRWQEEGIPGDVDEVRVSQLELVETPEVNGGRRDLEVECYRLGYELHTATPGDVVMGGGVMVYEDGWFSGFNPGAWLLFQVKDGKRELLDVDIACDTSPESNAFTAEYAWALTKAGVLEASALESNALYLDFCWMPVRFLNDLALRPSGEQSAALEKLTDYVSRAAIPEEYAGDYSSAMEVLGYAAEARELTDAARALYERLPAGNEKAMAVLPSYQEDAPSSQSTDFLPAASGSVSFDPLDYGITPGQLSLEEVPDWESMSIDALCVYYLRSDGAGAEGSSDELYHRFLNAPDEVLDYLASLGDQIAHRNGMTAAQELCRAIASADVFWYDNSPEFAAVMREAGKTASDESAAVLDILQQEHDAAVERNSAG